MNDFQKWKKCLRKQRFETREQAEQQKGMEVYHCHLCNGWHRTGGTAKLLAQIKRNRR